MTMADPDTKPPTGGAVDAPRCGGCGRVVEVCAFCEAEDCGNTACFHCILVDLREAIPEPHGHGG
jgi:hypothetical protein